MLSPGSDAAALDTETSSLDSVQGRILSIGICAVRGGVAGPPWSTLVDPGEWPTGADAQESAKVHGITQEMVQGAPGFADAWRLAQEKIGDLPVIAHHASFDQGFVDAECRRANLASTPSPWTDTRTLARTEFAERGRHGLDALARTLGVRARPKGEIHDAGHDAALLADCWVAWGNLDKPAQQGLFDAASAPSQDTDEAPLPPSLLLEVPSGIEPLRQWALRAGFLREEA